MRFRFKRLLNTWIQLTDSVDMGNSFHNLGPWWNVLDMFLFCLCSTCGLWLCRILCPWISVFCVNKVIRGGGSSLCTILYINVPSWILKLAESAPRCWTPQHSTVTEVWMNIKAVVEEFHVVHGKNPFHRINCIWPTSLQCSLLFD